MLVHRHLRFRGALLALLGLGVALGVVLLGGLSLWIQPRPPRVRGVLLNVEATSIVHAERITLRDDRGATWMFRVSPEVASDPHEPQSASHLRQHMLAGEWMQVHYRPTPDGPLAVRISDDDTSAD